MSEGTVRWFDKKKGYGFLKSDSQSEDVFVHYTDFASPSLKTLNEGDKVTFEILKGEKGLRAGNIKLLSNSTPV